MDHKGTKILETQRLTLRPFTINDAEAMYNNWASDPEVTEHLTWEFHENLGVTKELLASWVAQYEDLEYYQWAIVINEEGDEPIGGISVVGKNDLVESITIGYCIGKKWWRKGITSEALAALVKFFFEEVKVNRIAANHLLENPNSGKVMEKCGFKYEGTMRKATWDHNRGACDLVLYGLLAEDYKI